MGLLLILVASQDVGALVEKLRSDRVEERQAAEDALVARGEPILPALETFRASADAETRARLDQVVYRVRWWERVVWSGSAAVDVDAGRALWALDPAVRSTASHVDGRDVFIGLDNRIERRDLKDGARSWAAPAKGYPRGILRARDAVLWVGTAGAQAFSADLGAPLWTVDRESLQDWGTDGGRLFLLGPDGFAMHEAATGRKLWDCPEDVEKAALLPGGDAILAGKASTRRCRAEDGKAVWARNTSRKHLNPWLSLGPGRVLVVEVGERGSGPVCLDAASGRQIWRGTGYPVAAAFSDEGRVLHLVTAPRVESIGEHAVIDLERGEEIARQDLKSIPGRVVPMGDRIFVIDQQSSCCRVELRCYGLPAKGLLWKADTRGLPTEHSLFRHRLRTEVRGNRFVLVGQTSSGDYVEAYRIDSGAVISRWRR